MTREPPGMLMRNTNVDDATKCERTTTAKRKQKIKWRCKFQADRKNAHFHAFHSAPPCQQQQQQQQKQQQIHKHTIHEKNVCCSCGSYCLTSQSWHSFPFIARWACIVSAVHIPQLTNESLSPPGVYINLLSRAAAAGASERNELSERAQSVQIPNTIRTLRAINWRKNLILISIRSKNTFFPSFHSGIVVNDVHCS